MGKKKKGYWTYEKCYEEARNYKTRSAFAKNNSYVYQLALENGWLDDYTWFKRPEQHNKIWTYETCYQEARNYKTRSAFAKNSGGAYQVALENGWLDDYTWFERDLDVFVNKKDNVYAYYFEGLNSIYIGRTVNPKERNRSHRNKGTVYKFAKYHNIPIPEMIILENDLTPLEGLEKEEYYINKFREEGWSILNKAKTGIQCGSLGSIRHKNSYKLVYNAAKECNTLSEFRNNYGKYYQSAWSNGWLDDFPWLERQDNKPKEVLKISLDNRFLKKYTSTSEAGRLNNVQQANISNCCRGKQKTAGGFKWTYDTVDNFLIKKMNQNIANKGIVLRKTA